jgi:hypothetical protein
MSQKPGSSRLLLPFWVRLIYPEKWISPPGAPSMSLLVTSEKTRVLAAARSPPIHRYRENRAASTGLLFPKCHVKRLWSRSSRFPLTSGAVSSVVSVPTWPEVRLTSRLSPVTSAPPCLATGGRWTTWRRNRCSVFLVQKLLYPSYSTCS